MTRVYEPAREVPAQIIIEGYTEDVDLGVLTTGKEAEVHLIERIAPERSCLLARKLYRPPEERAFRNDITYRTHRRIDGKVRDGGLMRERVAGRNLQKAMDQRSSFGRKALHHQWVATEHEMLERLWTAGAPVPFPVANEGDAIVMEYVGARQEAAPRLAQYRTSRSGLRDLFDQVRAGVLALARAGVVHADLSPYNILVWQGRVWVIDLPQAVPYLANLDATDLLHRDCVNACAWFVRKGLDVDPEDLFVEALDVLFDLQMRDMFRAER